MNPYNELHKSITPTVTYAVEVNPSFKIVRGEITETVVASVRTTDQLRWKRLANYTLKDFKAESCRAAAEEYLRSVGKGGYRFLAAAPSPSWLGHVCIFMVFEDTQEPEEA